MKTGEVMLKFAVFSLHVVFLKIFSGILMTKDPFPANFSQMLKFP